MKIPTLKIGHLKPKLPIIQGGMALRISTAPLAAAVAESGGIGVIGATGMDTEELRMEIREAKKLTKGIVGVNIMFAVKEFAKLVKTAVEEKIDLIFTGAGFSRDIFQWGQEAGVPVVSIVSSPRLAMIAERYGAAAVVAEGNEAGGHLGTDQPLADILSPIRSVLKKIPLIAAGGIVDGKGLGKVFKMGADGVQMATRFVLSQECNVAESFKQMYLKAKADDIVVIPSPVGLPGRALKNTFVNKIIKGYQKNIKHCDGCLKNCSQQYCIMKALDNARLGNVEEGVIFAGKNVHLLHDILPVQEIIDRMFRECKMQGA